MSSSKELPALADELALLVDAVQDYAIFLLGPEGDIRTWNRGAARIMGYPAEEAVGKYFSIFYPDADRLWKPKHELEVAAAEGRIEDEGWRIRKNGELFWADTVITALRDPTGGILGFAKVTRDLTERRAAEERLRRSEEIFRMLVSSVRDYAIFMLDPKGNIETWNAGAERLKGYKASEIIGKHFSTFYSEEDIRNGKPQRELEIARETGSVRDEGWRIRKDGTRFWANVLITAVFDPNGQLRGFAKVTRDETESRRAEETQHALLQAEEERRRAETNVRIAQEASRAKDEFLMTLSHELRTPMTSILGWARMLPTLQPGDTMFHEAVAAISRSAQVQARLIDDVLDVSRIVSGKLRLAREVIDVERVVKSAVDAVRPTADAKAITLVTSLAPNLGTIMADATRLQQVLWNLLTNALKFTPRGGTVTVSAERTSSQMRINVRDSGEGIEPEFLPHVFEPFRQAESPRTRVHGGLGLGLSIVRYLIEAHGGSVSAESAGRGKGAMFSITLPISSVTSGMEATGSSDRREIDRQRLANLNILIVDDDREGRELTRIVLRQAGATVRAAESAATALEYIRDRMPDVILTDIAMPVMDGYEFARMLRSSPETKDVRLAALTAFPAGSAQAQKSGFDAYLSKPIDPLDLIESIAKVAGRGSS